MAFHLELTHAFNSYKPVFFYHKTSQEYMQEDLNTKLELPERYQYMTKNFQMNKWKISIVQNALSKPR